MYNCHKRITPSGKFERSGSIMSNKPILGITMGDPFGNGPEITVKALNDPTVYDRCRPLVVGDMTAMAYALKVAEKVSGIRLKLNAVKTPGEAKYEYGTIDVLDMGLVPAEAIPDTSDDPKAFGVGPTKVGGRGGLPVCEKGH